jgi:hypothetical protein
MVVPKPHNPQFAYRDQFSARMLWRTTARARRTLAPDVRILLGVAPRWLGPPDVGIEDLAFWRPQRLLHEPRHGAGHRLTAIGPVTAEAEFSGAQAGPVSMSP